MEGNWGNGSDKELEVKKQETGGEETVGVYGGVGGRRRGKGKGKGGGWERGA